MANIKTYRIESKDPVTGEWVLFLTWWGMPRTMGTGIEAAVDALYPSIDMRTVCDQTGDVVSEFGGRKQPVVE